MIVKRKYCILIIKKVPIKKLINLLLNVLGYMLPYKKCLRSRKLCLVEWDLEEWED